MTKIILDLCGGTGAWSRPYRNAGYDVRIVTLPEQDVRTYEPPNGVHGILSAPPCTHFSFVLNEKIKRDFDGGMEIVNACRRIIAESKPKWWALENPYGHLVKFLGKPRFVFQPWEFGDPWTKRTGIWGEFLIPRKTFSRWDEVRKLPLYVRPGRKKPNMVWLHKSSKALIPSFAEYKAETDAAFRAITPTGFANAFFEANP
jgi:hypothetical protein